MKKLVMLVSVFVLLASAPFAQAAAVIEDEVGPPGVVVKSTGLKGAQSMASLSVETMPLLSEKPERIYLYSVCSKQSPYLLSSRTAVMKHLSGIPQSMDRSLAPWAPYMIPTNGWQLYDACSTAYTFWDGVNSPASPILANEKGHRIVAGLILRGDVRKYWTRFSGTSTNFGGGMVNVATNSSDGLEIPFNSQFVGISFGADGQLDSYIRPEDGTWFVGEGDAVYNNGQIPSTNVYDVAIRFGANLTYNVAQPSGFDNLKAEFRAANQSFTAELIRKDGAVETVAHKVTIYSAIPAMSIGQDAVNVFLTVNGGQKMLQYHCETSTSLNPAVWVSLNDDMVTTGRIWSEPKDSPKRFFRLHTCDMVVPPPAF